MTADVVAIAPPPQTPGDRFALRVIQAGAIAVVLVVTTLNAFELDRFFVPKELVLHLTALLAGFVALRLIRTNAGRVDVCLAGYLILSALSALFATNNWLALRGLAITASGALIFWTARELRVAALDRPLLNGLAVAVVIASITSLLQAYGVDITLFSENRAPGGTMGNRNFVAHVAAFGTPLVLLAALRARHTRSWFLNAIGLTLVVACLVLTRSRAAWLAFAVVVVVFFLALLSSSAARRDLRIWRRTAVLLLFVAAGVATALLLPNALHWRSRNPYLQSMKHVADYEAGSGRGRLVQYQQSMLMTLRHPLFGVGPGNWAVEYPAHAAHNDPSLNDSEPGTTYNPWPSSDVIAWISERGLPAAIFLALTLLGILASAWKQIRTATDENSALVAMACLATLIGAVIAGMFDAVLLTAIPTLIVWAAAGVLYDPRLSTTTRPVWVVVMIAMIIAAAGVVRSTSQLYSMNAYVSDNDRASLERAAKIDPGNYRLQMRLARSGGRSRCAHANAARSLLPHAKAAIDVSRGCR